jgi:hypothetical protein
MVSRSANQVLKSINCVSKWWVENLEGDSENLGDVFAIDFGGNAFVTQQLYFATGKLVNFHYQMLGPICQRRFIQTDN